MRPRRCAPLRIAASVGTLTTMLMPTAPCKGAAGITERACCTTQAVTHLEDKELLFRGIAPPFPASSIWFLDVSTPWIP